MKKTFTLVLLAASLIMGCKLRENLKKKAEAAKQKDSPEMIASRKLIGSFEGTIGTAKLTLLINFTTADSLSGRSILNGKDHLLTGKLKKDAGKYILTLTELGSDSAKGVFALNTNTVLPDTLSGTWAPEKPSAKITQAKLELIRKAFEYRKDAGVYTASSTKELSEEDIKSLSKWETEVMMNEILARHGACFSKPNLRDAFETKAWYVPTSLDVNNKLTEIERKNVELLKAKVEE